MKRLSACGHDHEKCRYSTSENLAVPEAGSHKNADQFSVTILTGWCNTFLTSPSPPNLPQITKILRRERIFFFFKGLAVF